MKMVIFQIFLMFVGEIAAFPYLGRASRFLPFLKNYSCYSFNPKDYNDVASGTTDSPAVAKPWIRGPGWIIRSGPGSVKNDKLVQKLLYSIFHVPALK